MCPEAERSQRERLRDLAVFKRLNGNPSQLKRSISNKQVDASDVRSLPVLEDTLNYLMNLFDSKDYPFIVIHDFLFDRTRSIRQDLSMQNIVDEKAIHMYKKMVKFHIISLHKLQGCSDQNTSPLHLLNMEQLAKTLTSLFNLFFRMGNYTRFLSTIAAEASYLQYCIIQPYIDEVRVLAVSCINSGGYKLHPYPLSHLSRLLIMTESDVESFCKSCGLKICTDEKGNKLLPTKQMTFSHPKNGSQTNRFWGMEQFER